jgi:NADH-quinone oxidoreductase subunit L
VLPLIPLLPFLGFLVNTIAGRRLSKARSAAIACGAMLLSFVVALAAVRDLLLLPETGRAIDTVVFRWIVSGRFDAPLAFRLDPLSAVMVLVVTGIGFLIHLYSVAYMEEERGSEYARYFSYLNLFAAFMLVLVLGANFLVMFVGWEGVGLCSYLLIGFWYQKKSAADAGKKAFIVNRIGDWGFLLGILFVFTRFGTIDFREVAAAIAPLPAETVFGPLSIVALLLFVGATGKSAQIPLHVWLPDAMEGPTPVSALIHAATMVTAGVYMIGRNAVLYTHAPDVLLIVATVGAVTALFAATIGLVQNDIKRVLAYSTVSQLGLMFLGMGVGAFAAGIFHLYTHAFFKALLFLAAGAVIHALAGEQDLRRMGGLRRELPVTYWTFLIGALAIAGVPGLAGFFSKDEILYRTWASGHTVLWGLGSLTSLLTAVYMFRVVFLAFHGARPAPAVGSPAAHPGEEERPPARQVRDGARPAHAPLGAGPGHGGGPRHLHDAPWAMALPLVLLAVGAVVAGYLGLPHALGGGNRIEAFLAPSFAAHLFSGGEATPPPRETGSVESGLEAAAAGAHEAEAEIALMATASAIAIGGILIAGFFFLRRRDQAGAVAARWPGLYRLLAGKYYVDELYDAAIVQPIVEGSRTGLWRRVDVGLIDGAVNGAGHVVAGVSVVLRQLQTGSIRAYAASLLVGTVLILGYYLWR